MKFLAVIPARYASTRFPGKPLAMVKGVPMIWRVYEQTSRAFDNLCVATDDERIYNCVKERGGNAVMTSSAHNSGTDRVLEAADKFEVATGEKFDIIVNVQGDEPYIRPEQLEQLKSCFFTEDGEESSSVQLATLVKRISTVEELENANAPKVVVDSNWNALYFSRSVIPHPRGVELSDDYVASHTYYRHIGLYGYRKETLRQVCAMEQSYLEKTEKLEQLRWLETGLKIKVALTEFETYAVDTPEDLEKINAMK